MVSAMNRQRTNIRSRYARCGRRPASRPVPTHPRRSVLGMAADYLPGAVAAFTGLALMGVGISWL